MMQHGKKSKQSKRKKLDKQAPIKRVLRGAVTPEQHREKVPEWQRITPELQERLIRLSDEHCAKTFLRKYKSKLTKPAAPQAHYAEIWQRLCIHDLIGPEKRFCKFFCKPRLRVRKNQRLLTVDEWERFIGAVDALMTSGIAVPTYQDFVAIHVQAMTTPTGMSWGAHGDTNFLPWHRDYLFSLESRLRLFNPAVTIPYWDWSVDQAVPAQLSDPSDMARWGITRNAIVTNLPTPTQVANTLAENNWEDFRLSLEGIHNTVHVRVGGQMQTASSPSDPVFWLHHAFIDKLWADWQKLNTGADDKPVNTSEVLQPPPLLTRSVGQTFSTVAMGYVYT